MVLCKINDSFKFLETAILASQNLLTWFLCWLEITIHDEITVIMYRHYFSYFITIKKLLFVPRQKYYLYLEKWHIVACVCSPLCHHLYTIFHVVAWVCSFVSKHLQASLHGFDPHSLLLLFVLHPHAIIIFRMTILISNLPCLAARFFPREDCSICPLVPLFAYLRIWYSVIRQNIGSLIRWLSSMCFHFDQEGCWQWQLAVPAAILFCSTSMAAARTSASGAPTIVAFPPLPIHLLTAFNNDWLSHKYSNSSSIGVSRSASKYIANSGQFELEPSSCSLTLHCCFFFFHLRLLYSAPNFPFFAEPSPVVTWLLNP